MNIDKVIKTHQQYIDGGSWIIYDNGKVFSNHAGKFIGNVNKDGYLQHDVSIGKSRYTILSHHLVYYHFYRTIDGELTINHKDGNKTNNHPDNLELVTILENMQHAYENGLIRHKICRLTEDDVRFIRNCTLSYKELSKRFGINQSSISQVRNRKSYTWVE